LRARESYEGNSIYTAQDAFSSQKKKGNRKF
jgi:hypothetical protein